ncbi:spore coat U domain-containing protein [Asaia bogorensis]|uniref:Csu type fimbrial protein n=1 Tax=Asaia bogorensis TaxID=91915 RepID=UPI000EFC27ED|nr:spore coat U domain-containing protein [Asaia bogorensis]
MRAEIIKALAALVIAMLFGLAAPTAQSACAVSQPGTTSLGALSSLSLSTLGNTTLVSSGFACSGGLLSVVYTQSMNATIQAITSLTNGTGDVLPLQICDSASCAVPYATGQVISWQTTSLIGLLGLFNGVGGTLPLYLRIPSGTYNVSAGLYRGSITIGWTWNVCWGLGLLGLCVGQDVQNTPVPVTIPVEFTITADCRLSAPDVVFTPSPFVSSFGDVHQSLSVGCTKGQSYTVGISPGSHADGTSRAMSNSSGTLLRYEIYKKSSVDVWGSTGSARRSSATAETNAGKLDGVAVQGFAYTARILTGQTTPATGYYSDNLVIDVQF